MSSDQELASNPSADSLRKRYFYKIVTNSVGLVTNVLVHALAPRALGPMAFGNFNFLTQFFTQMMEFVNSRSTSGLLVKTSLRPNEKGLVVSYIYYTIMAAAGSFLLVSLAHWSGWDQSIWPQQQMIYVYYACAYGLMVWFNGALHMLCDAYGLTVAAEIFRTIQKVIAGLLILGLFVLHKITIDSFFYYYFVTLTLLSVAFWYVLHRHKVWPSFGDWNIGWTRFRSYMSEFVFYSYPIFTLFLFQAGVIIFDRWLLQRTSGSVEQGYFGFAYQVGYISFLFAGAFAPLFQREFSVAYKAEDDKQMAYLFNRYVPLLFSISVYFGAFVFFQADDIIKIFGGSRYADATVSLMVLSIFPIYFTFSFIMSSVYYATEKTRLFRNISIGVLIAGVPLSVFMLAPKTSGLGLGYGAAGLAVKTLVIQFLLANVQLYVNTRLLKVKFSKHFLFQVKNLTLTLGIAGLSVYGIEALLGTSAPVWASFMISGAVYSLLILAVADFAPEWVGLRLGDFETGIEAIKGSLKGVPAKVKDINAKPRILFLAARRSIHTVRWVNALVESGYDIHLVTMHPGGDPMDPRVHLYQLPHHPPYGYILNTFRLRRLMARIRPDLLHVHYISGYGTLGTLSGFHPRILSVWGMDVFDFPNISWTNRMLIKNNLRRADWICSTSEAMARRTDQILEGVEAKMTIVPFGVDLDEFAATPREPATDEIWVGTVKSMAHKYGVDILVKAFAGARQSLASSRPDLAQKLRLMIVGGGPQEAEIRELVTAEGLDPVTEIVGWVPHDQVATYLNRLDVYVAASRQESFGVAIVEASACERPVIVSDVGGLPEVVEHGETGLIVASEDVEGFTQSILALVESEELRLRLGLAGRKRVGKIFSWPSCVRWMSEIYRAADQGDSIPRPRS